MTSATLRLIPTTARAETEEWLQKSSRPCFSTTLTDEVKECYQQLACKAAYLKQVVTGYCRKLNDQQQLAEELNLLYDKLPEEYQNGDTPEKQKITQLIEQIDILDQLICADLAELHIEHKDPEKPYPFISIDGITNFLKSETEQLSQTLTSERAKQELNYNSLVFDGLPYVYSRALQNLAGNRSKQELIEDLKTFAKDKMDEMRFGIDVTYAKNETERQNTIERMQRISDFHIKYDCGMPFGNFVHGGSSRRPDDDYAEWAKAISAKVVFDLCKEIKTELDIEFGFSRYSYSSNHHFYFDNQGRDFLGYSTSRFKGYHKIESLLDLIEASGCFPDQFACQFRRSLASASPTENSTEIRNLSRQPEISINIAVDYLQAHGHSHYYGPTGTNHTTTAMASVYLDFLGRLKNRGETQLLKDTLSADQYQLASLLSSDSSMIALKASISNVPFYVANPNLAFFIENVALHNAEKFKPSEFDKLLSGRLNNASFTNELLKIHGVSFQLGKAGFDATKLNDLFSMESLIRGIAGSKQLSTELIQGIASHCSTSDEMAGQLVDSLSITENFQTLSGRLKIIHSLFKALERHDPLDLLEEFKNNFKQILERDITDSPALKSTEIGRIITSDWHPETEILILGEEHQNKGQTKAISESIQDLIIKGMTDLALELPFNYNREIDAFLADQKSIDELKAFFHSNMAEETDKIDSIIKIIEAAKTHNINIHCIDLSHDEQRFFCSMAQHSQTEIEKGLAPKEITDSFYFRRNLNMAEQLALIKNVSPEAGLVAICGTGHLNTRIAATSILTLFQEEQFSIRALELIGGDKYEIYEALDFRINPETFVAVKRKEQNRLYSGQNADGTYFVHVPENFADPALLV